MRKSAERGKDLVERILAQIGEHQSHADRGEALGCGKTDAAGTASDDGDAVL